MVNGFLALTKSIMRIVKKEYTNKKPKEVTVKYIHHVLETKLVLDDMVLSFGSKIIVSES